jgi:hypothetical protein
MTNAERIKQMSDKDLAIFIMCPTEYDVAFTKSCGCNGEMNKNCYQCTLEWLRQESEG